MSVKGGYAGRIPWRSTSRSSAVFFAHSNYGLRCVLSGLWDEALVFGGTEVAPTFGGFLEGALEATEHAYTVLKTGRGRSEKPRSAVNVNGSPVNSRPRTIPVTDIGTTIYRISGWRTLLNIRIEIVSITRKPKGSCLPRLACASPALSNSPPHFIV